MKIRYRNGTTVHNLPAVMFDITTRKGEAHGLCSEGKIWIHSIVGEGCTKGIIQVLINKFKTNKIVFTPLVTDNLKKVIRGKIKTLPKDHPDNPFGENIEFLECEWEKK